MKKPGDEKLCASLGEARRLVMVLSDRKRVATIVQDPVTKTVKVVVVAVGTP